MNKRIIKQFRILNVLYKEAIAYLSPINLSGW